ncbi:general stress protein [Sediminibacillus albus]|uniref:Heat induced stress protein YflT n=1 Tax=Sediminibacillus albus TaxID=407036 RepID=A0A1G8WDS0_9BACI|nr:general stress protein [Sediminibacillus albus]SDJ76287.1 Heat induced stress protein YflT [Sediminibacillus albus]
MAPFIKKYTNDEQLQQDVNKLSQKGVDKNNVYVLSHDKERTKRIADNAEANTIGLNEMDLSSAVGNMFSKKGDELRTKLKEVGLSEVEADNYEEEMDKGKVLLIVTETNNVEQILTNTL